MSIILRLSVHQLVDFLLRTGDIDNRVFNRSSMLEGTRLHGAYQAKQRDNYLAEYDLKYTFFLRDDIQITLEGRADGIIKHKDGGYTIDEIKTTTIDLHSFRDMNIEWHLGQAKCYAYMFAISHKLENIGVRLTYIRQGKEKEKYIEDYVFDIYSLEQFMMSLLEDYLSFYSIILRHQEERNKTIQGLSFPFNKYRLGQRELAKYCYSLAINGGRFFVEAPTGIGKTMSTLFPFIKAMQKDEQTKIFYLTAKTPGKEAAYNAINILKNKDLKLNDIIITAKEKICLNDKKECNPEQCSYAKAYYKKIQGVLRHSLLNYDTFDLNTILQIAKDNQICPFEFQLDLSLFCDVIICDYNYLFDPISYMKRYFDEDASHYLALVDEAHNLIDRSREMYSASVFSKTYDLARRSLRKSKNNKIKRLETKINKLYKLLDNYDEGETILEDIPLDIYKVFNSVTNFHQNMDEDIEKESTNELTDYFLEVNRWMKIYELFNEKYILYISKHGENKDIHLFCLDASAYLRNSMRQLKASVLFSATLQPLDYYIDTLGGNKETDPSLILPSPFPRNNLKLLVAPKVSTKYKNRDNTYQEVANYINAFIKNKKGNYFIYSPSYEYMSKLLNYVKLDEIDYFIQEKDMDDFSKEEFLLHFKNNPEKTTIGFLVIGGAFSEGIDLVNDRLIGAVVIGIGMPKINFRSDQISKYFKSQEMPGHDYAYLYPGMNKVMQAVGRVIRSEDDRGAVLLIDERYMNHQYQELYRSEWKHYEVVLTPDEVSEKLLNFFNS